jgi:Bin/amphiphysin/Rvs-like protein for vesicular trafficking
VSEKVNLLSSASSASEAAAAMTAPPSAKPQPKTFAHALARASLASSQALKTSGGAVAGKSAEEDPLAVALEKYAIAQEKVGEARLAQDAAVQARFLAGWSTTLNTQIQFATKARKGVDGARLSLDATKAKLRGHGGFNFSGGQRDHIVDDENLSEEARAEIEAKEDALFAQTEESTGVMKNVSLHSILCGMEEG